MKKQEVAIKKSLIHICARLHFFFDRIKARKDRDEQREEANKHKQIDC